MSERRVDRRRERALATDVFLVDESHSLAFCHVPKAASTWWTAAFARMAGIDNKKIEHLLNTNV
jgi:hypothetical protein